MSETAAPGARCQLPEGFCSRWFVSAASPVRAIAHTRLTAAAPALRSSEMISFVRSLIALALSLVLTVLTFGRVELNRKGRSTATDDSLGSSRPEVEKPLGDGPEDAWKPDQRGAAGPPEHEAH